MGTPVFIKEPFLQDSNMYRDLFRDAGRFDFVHEELGMTDPAISADLVVGVTNAFE